MKEIEKRFLSVENHHVGHVMDYFMEECHRTLEQQIMDYDIAFEEEYAKVIKIPG